jgi:hypothetical protein
MPMKCAPMMGKTSWCTWWKWSTTTAPVRVMTPTITPQLAWAATSAGTTPGRRRTSPMGAACAVTSIGSWRRRAAIVLGSGRTAATSASPTSSNPAAASHSAASASPDRSRSASQGAEDGRSEDRAEHRAKEHQGDAARPALGRVHVAGRGSGEQGGAVGGADADQAGQHRCRGVPRTAECGEPAAGGADPEAGRQYRDATEAVHQAPRRDRRERPRGKHDRGSQA